MTLEQLWHEAAKRGDHERMRQLERSMEQLDYHAYLYGKAMRETQNKP